MPGWLNHKVESRLLGEISTTRYAEDTIPMAESEDELKSLLVGVKEKIWKAGLEFNIQKISIMISGPITSWQIEEQWK